MEQTKPVAEMNSGEIILEIMAIHDHFDDYSASDPWGWDYPTMAMIFPTQTARLRALYAERRKRKEQGAHE